ncbi:sensor domain-containing diguanylate cyclase [Thiohalorhabdus sp. Cl-TMA]|uniref:diguanylate cyclase n=1 Tax=Thiohalorhabdus methylotrophus TaxID=3242694 RepID=A0ABV4TUM0_9GAMM
MTPAGHRIAAVSLFAGLSGLAIWLRLLYQQLSVAQQATANLVPLVIGAIGMALALWFHRSRVVLALLVLLGAYGLPLVFLPDNGVSAAVLFSGVALLVPLNLAVLAFLPERGLWTGSGIARAAFLLVQAGFLAWATVHPQGRLGELLQSPWLFSGSSQAGGLAPVVLGIYALAAVALLAVWVLRNSPLDGGFLGALVATAPPLAWGGEAGMTVAFWGLAVLVLSTALVQESYRLAFMDELTGLPGRRALEEQLQRMGAGFVIAMVDVDHFKNFNDTFGHDIGDHVLRMVAGKLRSVGGGGRAYRYGGEEFTVLFPNRTLEEAAETMDRVREEIAGSGFRLRGVDRPESPKKGAKKRGKGQGQGGRVQVTVSAGLAERTGDRMRPQEVIKAADELLYRAKKKGRNRVCR